MHADAVARLRELLQTNPLPAPRVCYAAPDGRERRLDRGTPDIVNRGDVRRDPVSHDEGAK